MAEVLQPNETPEPEPPPDTDDDDFVDDGLD
jgi:hypothetical protein